MAEFSIWSRVQRVGPKRYVARVSAILCGLEQRCAPEERARDCGSDLAARAAVIELAQELARDIRARGNRVMRPVAERRGPQALPLPANDRRARVQEPEQEFA